MIAIRTFFDSRLVVCAVLCGLLIGATALFGDKFPRMSFFLAPSLYYILAIITAVICLLLDWEARSARSHAAAAVFAATATVLVWQMIILSQGTPTRWLAWGRFPLGDAADFLSNAVILLQKGEFVSIRGRPMANAFIAGLWRLTGFDVALLGLAGAALCATAIAFYARSAIMVFGSAGAAFAIAVAGDFLHEHLAAASTEPIGFFTGTAACAVLLSAALKRSGLLFSLGLGALALAFMLRAGALFMLPALLLWPAFLPGPVNRRVAFAGGALACVLTAFAAHSLATAHFTPNSPGFVNAPKSWYAIIAMGDEALGRRPAGSVREEARWVQIFDDHPGLQDAPIDEQGRRFVKIVIEAASDRPLSVAMGAALEYKDQILRAGLFRFVDNKVARVATFALFLAGLALAAVKARHDPVAALIALGGLGLLMSIPFLHGGENRVHIATAGFLAGAVGYAVQYLINVLSRRIFHRALPNRGSVIATADRWDYAPLIVPAFVLAICLFVGVSTPGAAPQVRVDEAICPNGAELIATAAGKGSILNIGRPADGPAHTAEGLLGLQFEDWNALIAARDAWLATAAWRSVMIYAPISEQAFPLPAMMPSGGEMVSLMYLAQLSPGSQGDVGARLETPLRENDLRPGAAFRCLR